ncbi:adenylate kinase [Aureococcus anophagefferens]|nr:adenylate kinase [Aureococcus anophagefferens]
MRLLCCFNEILGPPGGGTLSKRLVRDDFFHVSAGDALRREVAEGTRLGRESEAFINDGFLVPDDVVTKLVVGQLARPGDRWLLDGFPRNIAQARELDRNGVDIDLVLNLEIPEAEILARLGGRRVHVASGRSYHVDWNPPEVEGLDDETGEPLVTRPDDTADAIRTRLERYDDLTQALVDHYESRGVLATFQGTESDVIYPPMKAHVADMLAEGI